MLLYNIVIKHFSNLALVVEETGIPWENYKVHQVWTPGVKVPHGTISVGNHFFKHSPKWRVDWNKYSPKWNRACHVWRVTFFLNSPTICNKYQINNTVMFNNLFCRFWQVINLVKKDQHSLKSCVDLFFLNFEFRCLRLLSFNARYKTCMSNPVPTHI